MWLQPAIDSVLRFVAGLLWQFRIPVAPRVRAAIPNGVLRLLFLLSSRL